MFLEPIILVTGIYNPFRVKRPLIWRNGRPEALFLQSNFSLYPLIYSSLFRKS